MSNINQLLARRFNEISLPDFMEPHIEEMDELFNRGGCLYVKHDKYGYEVAVFRTDGRSIRKLVERSA